MNDSMIGKWIEEKKYSRKEAAKVLGISAAALNKYEENPGKMPLHIYGLITRSKCATSSK
ncbi:helix-turn-helix transcriptional regulator [Paenibacillus sp. 7516]|uniref:helix-turn-helix domain-containing protein n=1 Tax=Paenibacillus sp. 7516 TaxID=2022549 RepID=UPI00148281C4|nr:helix-turn-helix transcriptional regulator [Paenibacillus sp. 7516]